MSPNKKQVLQSSENIPRKTRSHHDSSTHKIKQRNSSRHYRIPVNPKHHHHPHPHPNMHPHSHHYQYYHHAPHHPYYQHHPHHQPYHQPSARLPKAPQLEEEKQSSPLLPSSQPEQKPPKKPRSAFICFKDSKKKEMMEKAGIAKDNDNLLNKVFAKAWEALSEKERAFWNEEERNDKVRYVQEKAAYTGPWNHPKRRQKKDPNAPKRPMSAFLKFSKTRRKQVKEENPHMGNTDVSRLLGEIWRNASTEEKKPYVDAELVERAKYKEEVRQFREEKARTEATLACRDDAHLVRTGQIFRHNQHEQQQKLPYGYTSAFDRHRDSIPTVATHIDRLNIDPLVEEDSPSKPSAFRLPLPHHFHRSQHQGQDYFVTDSPHEPSWPELSLQPSLDHDSDPLPVVPGMPPSVQPIKVEDAAGHQSNRSYYFSDNSLHFSRYP